MNKNAPFIFGGIIVALVAVIGGAVWFSSLFKTSTDPAQNTKGTNLFSALFPFGNTGGVAPVTNTSGQNSAETGPVPFLRKVTGNPTAGATFLPNNIIRYTESESGHFFETPADSLQVTRISNTTVPGIQKIVWFPDLSFIIQYLDENNAIKNYRASLATSTEDQTLHGQFIAGYSAVVSTGTTTMLMLSKTSNGAVVQSANTDETNKKTLFSSPIKSWETLVAGGETLVATAPSPYAGFIYSVGANQSLQKIIGGFPELMTLPSPSGRFIAYSETSSGHFGLSVLDRQTNTVYKSPLNTIAKKCAWISENPAKLFCGVPSDATIQLENWFLGTVSLNDNAWVINPILGTATIISNLAEDGGTAIDMIDPTISSDGGYAIFRNKTDLSLWSLKLGH